MTRRHERPFWDRVTRLLLIGASAFALYANATTVVMPEYNRMVHWGLLGAAALLSTGDRTAARPRIWDLALAVLLAASTVFVILDYPSYVQRTGIVTTPELVFGVTMILLVLEITRRTVGWSLSLIVVVFIAYVAAGDRLTGILAHRGYDLRRMVGTFYLGSDGIYGLPIEISATFVIMFVVFGALLVASGGDRWFMDLSFLLTGRFRGGPGLSAIAASGLMGMISGSPVANVVTTGNLTIPLMKRAGFRPHFAGATVAVASAGAMFTPPLMGAGAFLIAELLRVPYSDVAKAAVLPAFLFYVALMAVVYVRAIHIGIEAGRAQPAIRLQDTLRAYGHMMPPVAVLVGLIFMGQSLMQAAFWSISLTVACSWLRPHTRITVSSLMSALESSGRGTIPIAVACAAAGIIVGTINLTGLGFTLSATLTALAEGKPFLLLLLVMGASLLLGMGIPPTAVYIVLAGLSVPAMTTAGFEPLASHFFIFFFSSMGAITPPVALAAYAAAPLAGANVNQTGWTAFRLGFVGYVIPFLCMYFTGLLLIGSVGEILFELSISLAIILSVALGLYFVTAAWNRRFPPSPSEAMEAVTGTHRRP